MNIHQSAELMVKLAIGTNSTVTARFNGIEVTANPGDNPSAIVRFYHMELGRSAEAYLNTPEGKRAAAEDEASKQAAQATLDAAMAELPALNFADLAVVINWLEKVCGPSRHIGTVTPSEIIVSTFCERGFTLEIDNEDPDNKNEGDFAHWLISQALNSLKELRYIHPVFLREAESWRKKFGHV